MRWNRHTLALLAIVAGMWYAAEAQSNGAAHLIALLTATMGALSWLHARANLRGLSVRLVGAKPAAQDETIRIPVELRATGAVAPCGLEVLVIGAGASMFVERVPSGGAVLVDLPPPVQHGGGALRLLVRSVYPMGLFTAESVVETAWVRRVHPKPAGDLPLPAADSSRQGDAVVVSTARAQTSGGDDFAGLREWRAGDSPRHIDWRAMARGGPLMVKSWSSAVHGVVVLDWNALALDNAARASQIARWMEICEGDGRPYELRMPGLTLRAGLGSAHLRRCLDVLATQATADAGTAVSSELKAGKGVSEIRFEQSSHLPARPLLFLSLALLLALLPLRGYIATSGLVVCALCLIWRGVLRRAVPHVLVRAGVIAAGITAVYFEYGELQGMEPGIALLLVLAGAKMLESRAPREFQVLALIGWFLAFCAILLENHLSRSVWAMAVLLLIAACMVRFRRSSPGAREPVRVTATLFAQALPLALMLFFVFPRGLLDLGAALGRSRFGETGIDNTLDPGSIARVALSTDVAFRVRFPDGEPPQNGNLYWRCLTLWDCDGLRWTRGERLGYMPMLSAKKSANDVRQIIDLEAHGRTWLPALDLPLSATMRGMRLSPEFDQTLVSPGPVRSSERIEVFSRLEQPPPRDLPDHHREAALQLPENVSPRLKQLTDYWESVAQNDEQVVQLALNYLRTQGFTYTLEPGEYAGPGGLEEFFLNGRTGFCEHFSASFATLMRMAGVPSRLVVGYLGGEFSDHNGGYLIVKQSDVHAWTEVWLERYGWLRIDPTAALAPDRVNIDLRSFLAGGAEEAERQRRSLWGRTAQRFRLLWDSVSYAWQNQVIDYNQEAQRGVLERFGLRQSRALLLLISAAVVFTVGVLVAWWLRRPARHADPWMRAWQRVCRKLAKAGVRPRLVNEGPFAYAERVSALRPDLAGTITPLAEMYAAGRYGPQRERLDEFKKRLSGFKPRRI
ncbi:transglutaminaseTgpA domain-containing protein [Prosthecobacter sp.]|uniref:transglutaminaseTgpA domain-containing protein n=1 Tax=Prosthecobacter sp. TaxID=1965333 RepID=UPI002ABB6650|nr:transglutaminaseTgpA domain-containing protein [Prosthecobacter sp.]MDZ4404698.1 transglutaminaseTgpA domain-containing protein [Prosthecobacter sp.]